MAIADALTSPARSNAVCSPPFVERCAPMRSPCFSENRKWGIAGETLRRQAKIHRHGVIHVDRIAVIGRGPESPMTHGVAGGVSEAVRQVLDHFDVIDGPVAAHDPANDDRTLHA